MDIFSGIWTQFLKPILGPLVESYRSYRGLNREHDVGIFKKLDAIASEAQLDELLNRRIYTSTFRIEDDHVLADLIEALHQIGNRYIDSTLQLRADNLAREMGALLGWVRQTFWSVGEGWLKFRPDPIDREVFESEWNELCQKIDRTWTAYQAYRMAVKERLRV